LESELLRLDNISKRFGGVTALHSVSLSADAGEFITLLGPSGCGKTTTLRIIAGLEDADAGRVFLSGQDVTALETRRRGVNMVFQNYALFPHMSAAANIAYSLRVRGLPKAEIRRLVAEALEMVQLSGFERRMPSELSGGQKQRVAVARALVNRPKVLLLDEPLGALDLQLRRQMQTELKKLQQQLGITFIYITHDQEEALTMSDRIAVMRKGRIEQIGTPLEVYERPKTSFAARFVGNANIIRQGGRTFALRSERVNMTGEDEAGVRDAAGLPARVSSRTFTGGQLRITAVLTAGGEIVASRHGIDSNLRPGDPVRVSWDSAHAVEVEDNDAETDVETTDES
jgi:spermidine/putrescine transport system ATP-binding protein